MSYFDDIADSIEEHEGFSSKPYPDPLAMSKLSKEDWMVVDRVWDSLHPTFGHGLTYITVEESEWIVKKRIKGIAVQLFRKIPYFISYPLKVKMVLIEMGYQMGVPGLMKFKKMLEKMERGDYKGMADEIRDSKFYREKQAPSRAEYYITMLESIGSEKK